MPEKLNETCPFENRSTRHYSTLGRAPELEASRKANLEILKVLSVLADEVGRVKPSWQPLPLREYELIAKKSHEISPHSPQSLSELFPIDENRTVDYVFEKEIASKNTILSNALGMAFWDKENQQHSKKATVRHILGLLQKKFADFVNSDGSELNLGAAVERSSAETLGLMITEEDFELLIHFQDLQERFESVGAIKKFNHCVKVPQIAEIILGIQISICEVLKEIRAKHPKWFKNNSIAFEEIAILDKNDEIVPSSRLLKLILHNVGEYMVYVDSKISAESILFNALKEALDDSVFHQKISLFQRTSRGILFEGIIDKVCPARRALSQMIMNQLVDRITR